MLVKQVSEIWNSDRWKRGWYAIMYKRESIHYHGYYDRFVVMWSLTC